ncbi:TPA: conjugal transfer protein TraM [Proteus mirabilis]|uniref:conjugal transfer protein TraM n=1 Tax=Proteus mirabilis TaxID=584 RepID=UPI00217F0722|nr:conjugal transfer protein TraM [Proteus mirabilis]MCS6748154.1 conjugal transfer protein TraM [Proteus mirabilis]HEK2843891.1 conjugal transfer protein TraM [Proteus mirabilis]
MSNEDKVDNLIKEIALKHGVALGRDDPILILQTLHEILINDSKKNQEELLNDLKSELEAVLQRWDSSSVEKAERTLNASLSASKELMREVIEQSTTAMAEKIRKEVDKTVNNAVIPIIKQTNHVTKINMIVAITLLITAGISLVRYIL